MATNNDKDRTVFWLLLGLGAAVLVARRGEAAAANGNGNGDARLYDYGPGPVPYGDDWRGTIVVTDNGNGTTVYDDEGPVPPVVPEGTSAVPGCPPKHIMHPLTGNCIPISGTTLLNGKGGGKTGGTKNPKGLDPYYDSGEDPAQLPAPSGNGDASPMGQQRPCRPAPTIALAGDYPAPGCVLSPFVPSPLGPVPPPIPGLWSVPSDWLPGGASAGGASAGLNLAP
jgi:hypothetical protein